MKLLYKLSNKVTVQAEGETMKDVFYQLVKLQDAFGEEGCGKCQNKDIRYRVRKVKTDDGEEYEFLELGCPQCYAKLEYGVANDKSGDIYPKRMETGKRGKAVRTDDGKPKYLPNRGWIKFEKEE